MPKIEKIKKKKTTKKAIHLPSKPKSAKKTKSSPVEYYHCLLTQAQNDWLDPTTGTKQKITACCKKCKSNAPALNNQRNLELEKLITSYRQVGDSLTKLLQPLKK